MLNYELPEMLELSLGHRKLYKQLMNLRNMEKVCLPREEYEKMKERLKKLEELEKIDFDLIRQFKSSLDDVKAGRIRRVA